MRRLSILFVISIMLILLIKDKEERWLGIGLTAVFTAYLYFVYWSTGGI
jgi:Ca2+/Na+ antiporter